SVQCAAAHECDRGALRHEALRGALSARRRHLVHLARAWFRVVAAALQGASGAHVLRVATRSFGRARAGELGSRGLDRSPPLRSLLVALCLAGCSSRPVEIVVAPDPLSDAMNAYATLFHAPDARTVW